MHLEYIKPVDGKREYQIGTSAIAIGGLGRELERMASMARQNVDESFQAVLDGNSKRLAGVEKTEEYVDFLNKEISKYISKIMVFEANERDSAVVSAYFKVSSNLERIGDHAINICEYTKMMEKKGIGFSDLAKGEIREMRQVSLWAMDLIQELARVGTENFQPILDAEQKIDDLTTLYRQNQMVRLQSGSCSDEACVLYSEMLTDFERIGDHVKNIGQELNRVQMMLQK